MLLSQRLRSSFLGSFSLPRLVLTALLLLGGVGRLRAEDFGPVRRGDVNVIDTPTADVVDHYGYNVAFRFGREGSLQAKTAFGIFPRLNLGFGLDSEGVIGVGDSRMNKPTLNIKFRMFDGKGVLPALALGFDGQGYVWNKKTDEYEQREKGVFLVGSKEIGVPELMMHAGVDFFDFDEKTKTRGFAGFSYVYLDTVGLLFEWDNFTEWKERRINFGLRYFVTPVFTVDAIGRNVPEPGTRHQRETERVLRLSYTGSF